LKQVWSREGKLKPKPGPSHAPCALDGAIPYHQMIGSSTACLDGIHPNSSIVSGHIPHSGFNVHPLAHGVSTEVPDCQCNMPMPPFFNDLFLASLARVDPTLCHCVSIAATSCWPDLVVSHGEVACSRFRLGLCRVATWRVQISKEKRYVAVLFGASQDITISSYSQKPPAIPCFASRTRSPGARGIGKNSTMTMSVILLLCGLSESSSATRAESELL
jgi:hypothetical protein